MGCVGFASWRCFGQEGMGAAAAAVSGGRCERFGCSSPSPSPFSLCAAALNSLCALVDFGLLLLALLCGSQASTLSLSVLINTHKHAHATTTSTAVAQACGHKTLSCTQKTTACTKTSSESTHLHTHTSTIHTAARAQTKMHTRNNNNRALKNTQMYMHSCIHHTNCGQRNTHTHTHTYKHTQTNNKNR